MLTVFTLTFVSTGMKNTAFVVGLFIGLSTIVVLIMTSYYRNIQGNIIIVIIIRINKYIIRNALCGTCIYPMLFPYN